MIKFLILFFVLGLPIAISSIYFDCYGSCPSQNLTIGCEINLSSGNIVQLGNISPFIYHEFFIDSYNYREDLFCYYPYSITSLTGKNIQVFNKQPISSVSPVNVSPINPPIKPGPQNPPNNPQNKNPRIKLLNLSKQNLSLDINWSFDNQTFTPTLTEELKEVSHYFKCPDSCRAELETHQFFRNEYSDDPRVLFPSKKYEITKCSILYNFNKDHVNELITNSLSKFEKGSYFAKVHSVYKNDKWQYDEVLYCEYYSEMESGVETFAEDETPYDRLGYVEPLDPSNIVLRLDNQTILLPPGYKIYNGIIIESEPNLDLWLEEYALYSNKDYLYLPILLNYIEENDYIFYLLDNGYLSINFGDHSFCVLIENNRIDYVLSNCPSNSAKLYISKDAFESNSIKEVWGSKVKYEPNNLIGSIKLFIFELLLKINL